MDERGGYYSAVSSGWVSVNTAHPHAVVVNTFPLVLRVQQVPKSASKVKPLQLC